MAKHVQLIIRPEAFDAWVDSGGYMGSAVTPIRARSLLAGG